MGWGALGVVGGGSGKIRSTDGGDDESDDEQSQAQAKYALREVHRE
jgi:hypothetical protein